MISGMIRPVRTKINDDEMIYEVVHTGKFSTHGTRIYIYMPMAKQNLTNDNKMHLVPF